MADTRCQKADNRNQTSDMDCTGWKDLWYWPEADTVSVAPLPPGFPHILRSDALQSLARCPYSPSYRRIRWPFLRSDTHQSPAPSLCTEEAMEEELPGRLPYNTHHTTCVVSYSAAQVGIPSVPSTLGETTVCPSLYLTLGCQLSLYHQIVRRKEI